MKLRPSFHSSRLPNHRSRHFVSRHLTLLSGLLVLGGLVVLSAVLSGAAGAKQSKSGTTAAKSSLSLNPALHPLVVPVLYTVNSLNDPGDGTCDVAECTLREAMAAATSGTDTIDITVTGTINLASALPDIAAGVTINGPGANLLTVQRNTAGLFRIFTIASGAITVNITGMTISNGCTADGTIGQDGGGILNNTSATLNLTNVAISGNRTRDGIPSGAGSGRRGNGGGVSNSGTLTIANSTISGNFTGAGGAGGNYGGDGGGVSNTGTLTIINSTITGNVTGDGGIGPGPPGGGGNGGGVYTNTSTVTIVNSTITGNRTGLGPHNSFGTGPTGLGGGILGNPTINNTIIAGNVGSDIVGTVDPASSFNLIGTGGSGGLTNGVNHNQVGVANPGLGALANNGGPTMTHALLVGSPALDAGSNAFITNPPFSGPPFTDQRDTGFSRIVDGPDADTTDTVDIGAFEAQVSVEDITDKTTNEDTQLQFTFNVGGAASITSVTATSGNIALVPNNAANIAVSGSGSTRTLTINPVANQFGVSTITVTVNGTNGQSMTDTFVLTVSAVADTPSVTNANTNEDTQTTSGLVISRNAVDGTEVTHFKISGIANGTLFKNNGTTQINNNDFITFAEGNAGLKFTPGANLFSPSTSFSFQVQGATSNIGNGLSSGFATATITVSPVADEPSVTGATTNVNTQTTSGLVISRNAADGAEVTHFKITGPANGTLFKNDGTTQITSNQFITFAEGNAGLKFTPANNLVSPSDIFNFQVTASTSSSNAGLGGSTIATITVNCGATVVTNGSDNGPGSLRAIINSACPGSTITFAANLVSPIMLTTGELLVNKNLTITGPGANLLAVQRNTAAGTPTFRIFEIGSGGPITVNISGMTISNGRSPEFVDSRDMVDGGGIRVKGATLNLTNVAISGNFTGSGGPGGQGSGDGGAGGGVSNTGALTIVNSTISGNGTGQGGSTSLSRHGGDGGGVSNTGTLTIVNSTISGNQTGGGGSQGHGRGGDGGGVSNTGTLTIVNSTISGNKTGPGGSGGPGLGGGGGGGGGGVSNTGTLTIVNSTISGNFTGAGLTYAEGSGSGSDGGGLSNTGMLTIVNSTISGNGTGAGGPGGYPYPTQPGTGGRGGGIFTNISTLTIKSTIIAGNAVASGGQGPDINGTVDPASSFNLIGTGGSGGLTNGVNNNQVGVANPGLGPLANNGGPTMTQALLPGSPAIDAGSNSFIANPPFSGPPFTDQRGFARITSTTVDIGAFESRGFTFSATGGTPQSATITTVFAAPLVATVSSASSEPVAGGVVTFTAPSSGASGTFPGNVITTTATTNAGGVATSPTFTANGTAGGPYNVVASIGTGLPTVNFALTNLKVSQTINFGALANKTFGDPDFTVSATATSGLAVSFTASGQCTVAVNTVHITGAGLCTITASQAGNSNFNPAADVPQNFTIANRALIALSQSNYSVNESTGFVTITVNRTGDLSVPFNVDYATDDTGSSNVCGTLNTGMASSRCDFGLTLGTLRFAANDTQKTFLIPITQDSYTEGPEMFTVNLSNLTGNGAALGTPSNATVTIDDSTAPAPNANDDTDAFVRQQYRDFLNREADPSGLAFWTNEITSCSNDAGCRDIKRINVSAAFFLSIEFQTTGNLVRSFYVAALDRPLTNNMPAFVEFERDTQAVQRGVIVGQGNWQQTLNDNRDAFMKDFVLRAEFVGLYPTTDTPTQYVDKLYMHAAVTPATPAERQAAIDEFIGTTHPSLAEDAGARGRALLRVTQNAAFLQREMNRSFVQMEYFGYLRRNPNDAPDTNSAGYDFWVSKLNQFNGNFVDAEMVKAFLISAEYRQRFGP